MTDRRRFVSRHSSSRAGEECKKLEESTNKTQRLTMVKHGKDKKRRAGRYGKTKLKVRSS
jgi:hypothetical protein